MSTKKDLVIHQYKYLKSQLEVYIDGSVFPSLDDYDITDIIFYLNLYFQKGTEEGYIDTIEKLVVEPKPKVIREKKQPEEKEIIEEVVEEPKDIRRSSRGLI